MYACVYACTTLGNTLRHYFENHGNVVECLRKMRTDFGRREAPSAPYRYLVKKVNETGVKSQKNIAYIREYCCWGRKCL